MPLLSLRFIWAALLAVTTAPALSAEGARWSYDGSTGPAHWGTLSPGYAACAQGRSQSPIDLTAGTPQNLSEVRIAWNPNSLWTVVNNGHTVQATAQEGGHAIIDGESWTLLQFHFHTPSEHAIDGARAPMEVHFVHQHADGRLAVIGVMMTGGGENGLFHKVLGHAPLVVGEAAPEPLDPTELMPISTGLLRYSGSLTTPPCSERVLWTVMAQPIAVSDSDIKRFSRMYPMNARPLMPLNARQILTD